MKKRERKNVSKLSKLALLNPRNLEKEVHRYGYNFSWKAHILVMILSLLGISGIGVLFKLQPTYFAITLATVVIFLPVYILASYRRMYEQKRFADATTYMEQILYSFQKNRKILTSLKETQQIFPDGQMRDVIGAAIDYLSQGQAISNKGLLRESLELIEKSYECSKIRMVHELIVSSEEYGGSEEKSISLLLMDLEGWKRRGYKLQAKKKQQHTDNIISIIVATALCAVALYVIDAIRTLYPNAGSDMSSIFDMQIIQISSLIFIIFMFFVMAKSQKTLAANWLKNGNLYDEKYLLNSYETVMEYDEVKQKRKSLVYAAPFLIAAIPVFILYKAWLGIVLLLIGVFMLMQHRVGYNLAKKDVDQELYIILPQWLMHMALLLQSNNVQVSLAKSISGSPDILQKELDLLLKRLKERPDSLSTYLGFCEKFDIPEAQSCMRMLHSISESGTGNADIQINNLLQRVNEMQEQADDIRDNNIAFKAKMIFSYPVLAATVKLLIDLTIGMIYMMSMLGNMGGM